MKFKNPSLFFLNGRKDGHIDRRTDGQAQSNMPRHNNYTSGWQLERV